MKLDTTIKLMKMVLSFIYKTIEYIVVEIIENCLKGGKIVFGTINSFVLSAKLNIHTILKKETFFFAIIVICIIYLFNSRKLKSYFNKR